MGHKDRQFIEALGRGLFVLEALARAKHPLSNGELSAITGLAPSTISRLVHTLNALGYVKLSREGRTYELTPKNLTLGYPVLSGMQLLYQARPQLADISLKTGETAALAIRDKLHATFVAVHEGSKMVAVRLATGGRLPIAVSAAGVALVAALPEAERRQTVARVYSEIRRTGQSPDDFQRTLDHCIRNRFAIVRGLWQPGIGGVSVPIQVRGECAALTITVATGSVSELTMSTTFVEVLHEAATTLGSTLWDGRQRLAPPAAI
jgi:DNA-binding IclR family transcriptional regulator